MFGCAILCTSAGKVSFHSPDSPPVSSDKVAQAIETIASVSEENSAAVEQVSASTEELTTQVEGVSISATEMANLAKTLELIVLEFKLV
jgi:methyl-accepting chemotaxis protein